MNVVKQAVSLSRRGRVPSPAEFVFDPVTALRNQVALMRASAERWRQLANGPFRVCHVAECVALSMAHDLEEWADADEARAKDLEEKKSGRN